MIWQDIATIGATVVVSLGGGGAIVLGLANFIGKILANKYVEKVKQEFQHVEESLETYIATHGAALPKSALENLAKAKRYASWGKVKVTDGDVCDDAIKYAEQTMNELEEIEKELYEAVWSQSSA